MRRRCRRVALPLALLLAPPAAAPDDCEIQIDGAELEIVAGGSAEQRRD